MKFHNRTEIKVHDFILLEKADGNDGMPFRILKESLKNLEKYDNVLLFEKLELCPTRIQKKNPGSKIVRR